MKNLIQVILGTLFLSGCATVAQGPSYSQARALKTISGYATVYVLRDYAEPTAWGAKIHIDGTPVATLNQKGFTWVYVKPGNKDIKAVWPGASSLKDSAISVETVAGKTYYIELTGVSQMTDFTVTT